MRYFNNLYAQYSSDKWNFIMGVDFGFQQHDKNSSNYKAWFVPTLIGQYCLNDRWKTAIRFEYFQDRAHFIVPNLDNAIFSTSWNWDYHPIDLLTLRIEARYFHGLIDVLNSDPNRISMIGSIAFRFKKSWKPTSAASPH